MEGNKKKGYASAISAGLNAAFAAVSAKFITPQIVKYGFVILFNLTMWGCYVNSLKALSSLQATATNFTANFLSSGLAGYIFCSKNPYPFRCLAHIVVGALVLSKSSIEKKVNTDKHLSAFHFTLLFQISDELEFPSSLPI